MAETINGVPIGDLPGIESVPDDSMLVVEFLGKAYHMPGAVLRQMIQDVLDSMGDSVDDVTEARLTAAIETVLASGKYNGVSPSVEVLDEEDGTSVIHIIDAFGVKKYPVEVKGARNAVQYVEQELTDEQKAQARENIGIGEIGNSVVVELSGNPTDGYTALLSGEAVTGDELDEMAKNGSHITGVATESLVFQVSNGINGTSYTVPNGTIFSYGNAIVTGNPGFYGTGGVHSFEFRVCLQDYNFAIAYKAVANQDEKVWVSATQATHMVFRLGISQGIPAVLYGTQMLYGNSVPNMNYLYTILAESQLLNRPVFCYQVNMPFYTEDGTEMTPYSGVLFSLKINSAYQYFFEAEHEGYVYRFTVKQNEGYSCTAEPTEVYKKVQSKADDLKAEDGTLFLLSAGEPIGEGVPLPAGSSDDSKIFIADLNTSTYEDIKAANDAGKICYALWGGYTACMLTTLSGDSAIFTTLLDPHLGIYVKFTKGTAGVSDFGLTDSHSILYEPQSLTDAQKAQARENIGALSADDIDVNSIGSNVFVADYDTTTFAEIKAAHDAGKVCFLNLDGLMLPLLYLSDTEAFFIREVNETTDYKVTVTSAGGKDVTLVDKNTPIYVAQSLTDAQKTQARSNIGAAAVADLSNYVTTGTAQTITGVKTFNAPANVAGTEQHTAKFKTSNGGSIVFGKEGPNSGTMIRLDQADGTCRLRFRASATAGAMVWEQPEQGAQLYVDLGKEGVDKRRITFPSSAGTLALTSQIPSLSGYLPLSGGLMTGSLKFQAASLPGKSLQYICGIDAFANGGEMGWQSKADFLSGYLTTTGTAARATADANGNNIANTYAKVTTANDYNGEQRFKNASYCPTITDTASGIGCAFKASRGLVNELLADKIIATASTGKIPFYSYTGASNGSMTGLTEFAYLSPGAFILRPPSGEGGQIQLEAAANDPTNTGICIDTAGGNFRIFGLQSADGVTTTGYGSVLAIHPYAKAITGGYSFDGIAAKATADGNGNNIASTYLPKSGGTMAGPLVITGGDSTTAGKLILNNNGSGQITDSGTSTLFGFVSTGNLTVGHSSYNLVMRGKASRPTYNGANVALVSDVVEAANGSLKVTLSGTSVDKTLAQIETALNAGRHVYMAENDGQVYQLSMHMAGMMACFTSVVASDTQVTVKTVIVYDGMSPSVFKKTL